jgi:hypothetical protein
MKTIRVSTTHGSGTPGNLDSNKSESICVESESIHPRDGVPSMTGEQRQPMDSGTRLPEKSTTPLSSVQSVSEEPLQDVKHAVSFLMENSENHAL